jgi:hypothetical protein
MVIDMTVILKSRAKGEGPISDGILHLVDDDISILQYANDGVLFVDL